VRVAIVCGGISSEHEVSCVSGGGVLHAIDRTFFDPVVIGMKKSGGVVLLSDDYCLEIVNGQMPTIDESLPELTNGWSDLLSDPINAEIAFPVLHGTFGEDGTFQQICEEIGLRYVGSGVEASAVAMEKSAAKATFASVGLAVVPGITITHEQWNENSELCLMRVADLINGTYPIFVKPSRSGSSRGTHKVNSSENIESAIVDALKYDSIVLVEQAINAREIECAVLDEISTSGMREIFVSPPGEIKISADHPFYDFESKYLDGATSVHIPAEISPELNDEIRNKAMQAFIALDCLGYARVDFFLDRDTNRLYINEINTIPGFTSTSVYPALMNAAGISYSELITSLINFALI
jgi:D-alanine-D-alanine ligase